MPSDHEADDDARLVRSVIDGDSDIGVDRWDESAFVAQLEGIRQIIATLDDLAADPAQAPPAKARWGPFRLDAEIGRGSYGVVWRAYDEAVARDVAVKLYSASDVPAEPRLLARVRHSNVVTVFGAGTYEGVAGIWMELVHGRTLAARVHSEGLLPPADVVRIGAQVCGALEAVHAAHLVHQDVKARNVMEQDDGRVVLMDLGAGQPTGPGARPGAVSGTPLYMAPEVVIGAQPSPQSDVYSLGVLLYYLLTGTYPTYAADLDELRALHARHEARFDARRQESALRNLRPEVSRSLARAIVKALAPLSKRHESAARLKSVLQALVPDRSAPARRRPWLKWLAPAGLVLVGTSVGWWAGRGTPRPSAPSGGTLLTRLTSNAGLSTDPARSRDGAMIAYASDRAQPGNLDIWVQPIASSTPLRLTDHSSDDSQPSFSPDGSLIAFRSERDGGGVYVVPTLGGAPRLVARGGRLPRFAPDSSRVAYLTQAPRGVCVSSLDGRLELEFPVDVAVVPNSITWSPDGTRLLFVAVGPTRQPDWTVLTLGAAAPTATVLGAFAHLRAHSLDVLNRWPIPGDWVGNRILFSGRMGDATNIWEVGLSPQLKLAGPPLRLSVSTEDQYQPSIGPDGRLLFSTRTESYALWMLPFGKSPDVRPRLLVPYDSLRGLHALTPDGRWLAFSPPRPEPMLQLLDLTTGARTTLALDSASLESHPEPVLRPDGSAVFYSVREGDSYSVRRVQRANGASEEVCRGCGQVTDSSPDDRYLLLKHGIPKGAAIHVLDRRTGSKREILAHPRREVYRARLSPDARWVCFHAVAFDSPTGEFVAPFRGLESIPPSDWIAITDGKALTDAPRWSPDGSAVLYVSDRDGFRCIWGQRLHPTSKRPVGPPFSVHHLHDRAHSMSTLDFRGIDFTVARDKAVVTMGQARGSVWWAELR